MNRITIAFAVLCLLAASSWLLGELLPAPISVPEQFAFCTFLLAGASIISLRIRPVPPVDRSRRYSILFWATILFALPLVLLPLSAGSLDDTARSLLFTLVPAIVVFVMAQTDAVEGLRLLGPALAGTAGAALILPFQLPTTNHGWFAFAAAVCCTAAVAYASLRLHALLTETSIAQAISLCSAGPCAVAILLTFVGARAPSALLGKPALASIVAHLLLTTLTLWLTIWLLRDLSPVRFASRFLLIPLITVVEGYLILRPENTWTLIAGVALMAAGVMMLIREGGSTTAA